MHNVSMSSSSVAIIYMFAAFSHQQRNCRYLAKELGSPGGSSTQCPAVWGRTDIRLFTWSRLEMSTGSSSCSLKIIIIAPTISALLLLTWKHVTWKKLSKRERWKVLVIFSVSLDRPTSQPTLDFSLPTSGDRPYCGATRRLHYADKNSYETSIPLLKAEPSLWHYHLVVLSCKG